MVSDSHEAETQARDGICIEYHADQEIIIDTADDQFSVVAHSTAFTAWLATLLKVFGVK